MTPKIKCQCPIYCRFCGAKLKRDIVGHYCPTDNCQEQYEVKGCVIGSTGRERRK